MLTAMLFLEGMGMCGHCLGLYSILVKNRDEISKLLSHLPIHITEGKLKILETNPKFEEIANSIAVPYFLHIWDLFV